MQRTIHTCIGFAIIVGALLTISGIFLVPHILVIMDTPFDVLPQSITYFRIYFMGSLFFVMYNMTSSILRSVGDSVTPLKYLAVSSISNIVFDYILVGMMKMGVGAAAFATIMSQFISAFLSSDVEYEYFKLSSYTTLILLALIVTRTFGTFLTPIVSEVGKHILNLAILLVM